MENNHHISQVTPEPINDSWCLYYVPLLSDPVWLAASVVSFAFANTWPVWFGSSLRIVSANNQFLNLIWQINLHSHFFKVQIFTKPPTRVLPVGMIGMQEAPWGMLATLSVGSGLWTQRKCGTDCEDGLGRWFSWSVEVGWVGHGQTWDRAKYWDYTFSQS